MFPCMILKMMPSPQNMGKHNATPESQLKNGIVFKRSKRKKNMFSYSSSLKIAEQQWKGLLGSFREIERIFSPPFFFTENKIS